MATSRSRRPKFQEVGVTGLRIWGGRVYEEWLPQLVGEKGRKVLREMTEQDPVIGGILFAIEQLVRQVQWTFTPRDETQEASDAAEFAQQCLADMQPHWQDTLSEILSMLPYGWSWMEVVYKYRNGPHNDPQRTSQFDDGKIGWKTWGIRSQDTLLNWDQDAAGNINGLVQSAPPDFQKRTIPLSKSLHFVTKSRKGNPEGVSMLRAAYRPWYFKKHIEQIEGIGVERDLAGLPVMWVPPELLADNATAEQQSLRQELQKIVTNIRRDEQEGVLMPLVYDESGKERYKLSLISTGGQRQFDTDKIIQRYDQRIAMTLMADFVLMGHEQVGSFALSDNKTALFATALGAWLDSIARTITTFEMPRLFKMNGMDVALAPTLAHSDIENADLGKLGTYLQALAAAGMTVFPNPLIEKHLLEQAGIPTPEEMPSQTEAMVNQALAELGVGGDEGGNEPPPTGPESNSPATLRQKNRTNPQGAAEAAGTPMRQSTFAEEGVGLGYERPPETEQFYNPYHGKRGRFDFAPMGTSTIVGGSLVKQFGGQAAAIRELHARGHKPGQIAKMLGVRPQAVYGQIKKVKAKQVARDGTTSLGRKVQEDMAKMQAQAAAKGGVVRGPTRRAAEARRDMLRSEIDGDYAMGNIDQMTYMRRLHEVDAMSTHALMAQKSSAGTPIRTQNTPVTPTGPKTSHGGKMTPGGAEMAGAHGPHHPPKTEVVGGQKVLVKEPGGAGHVVPAKDVMGDTMAGAKIHGQHLEPGHVQDRKYSTGDEQRVLVHQTSHGGQVEVPLGSRGTESRHGGGVLHGPGHKGGEVVQTSHGGEKVKGKLDNTRAVRHGAEHDAAVAAKRAEQPGSSALISNPGRVTRDALLDNDLSLDRGSIGQATHADRLRQIKVEQAARRGPESGAATQSAKAAVAQGRARGVAAKPLNSDGVIPHEAMGKHVEIIDAAGAGKVSGPMVITKDLAGGYGQSVRPHTSEAWQGQVTTKGGKKVDVVVKPIRGEAPGMRPGQISDGNGAGREVASGIVSSYMERGGATVSAPHGTIRDTPKGKAYVGEWVKGKIDDRGTVTQELAVYDAVIGNLDRHGANWKSDAAGKIYPIDHGLAFPDQTHFGFANTQWMGMHQNKPLTARSRSALKYIKSNEKQFRADLEPLIGKKATNLAVARVDHMLSSDRVMDTDTLLTAGYTSHAAGRRAVRSAGARVVRGGGGRQRGQALAQINRLFNNNPHNAGAATRARRNRGEMKQRQFKRRLKTYEADRLWSAQRHIARVGIPSHARRQGIRPGARPRMNRRGRIGWWKQLPNGNWGWVDLQPGRH